MSPFEQAEARGGSLHVIDLDGSCRTFANGEIKLTNGLGFSPDGKRLYHSDSRNNMVGVYDVSSDGGVGERRVFARVEPGVPDGLAVAEDGSVWVAVAGAARACSTLRERRGRDAAARRHQPCFGGDDLRDLYA
jgi:gluconolactonase